MEWRGLKYCVCDWPQFNNRRIVDYSDTYEVSSEGDIRFRKTKELLEKKINRDGYQFVTLVKDGIEKDRTVHRIVASTYQDKCGEINEVVNHLDWNKTNNSVSNLQWCTNKENLEYGGNPNVPPKRKKNKGENGPYKGEGSHAPRLIEDFDWRKYRLTTIE
jgi:hypothetical protein